MNLEYRKRLVILFREFRYSCYFEIRAYSSRILAWPTFPPEFYTNYSKRRRDYEDANIFTPHNNGRDATGPEQPKTHSYSQKRIKLVHITSYQDDLSSHMAAGQNSNAISPPNKCTGDNGSDDGSELEVETSIRLTELKSSDTWKKYCSNSGSPSADQIASGGGQLSDSFASTSPRANLAHRYFDLPSANSSVSDELDYNNSVSESSDDTEHDRNTIIWNEYQAPGSEEEDDDGDFEDDGTGDSEDDDEEELDELQLEDEVVDLYDDSAYSSFDHQSFERSPSPWYSPGPSSPAVPGPSNTRQGPRPVTRARERLRPTASGGVEAYIFDEGPEYELRLAHEAEVIAAWRRYKARGSTYPFDPEFKIIQGAAEPPVSFFGESEDDSGGDEGSKIEDVKGKQKA